MLLNWMVRLTAAVMSKLETCIMNALELVAQSNVKLYVYAKAVALTVRLKLTLEHVDNPATAEAIALVSVLATSINVVPLRQVKRKRPSLTPLMKTVCTSRMAAEPSSMNCHSRTLRYRSSSGVLMADVFWMRMATFKWSPPPASCMRARM